MIRKKGQHATSTVPFYKKERGYASQLDVRRETSYTNPRTTDSLHNQISMMNAGIGYERSDSLYTGQRELNGNGIFNIDIFHTKAG